MSFKHLYRYKYFVLAAVFSFACLTSYSQQLKPQNEFWRNVRYGGALGLGFGNDSFSIAIAPSAIYQVSEKFGTGLALNFEYSKFGDSEFTAYGGSILNFFNPIPPIQLSAVLQQLRVTTNY
ncbi:MAG: alpha-ketoglutarate decarboxylase, partial [Eudoraea sp.]|nr:alpha-ketoglutarate decarboxylase [Eudoraea sp.]